ncbi:hypothetical protein QUA43_30720 [Microcoleus sp. N9_B4]|uniref:hypothetical protein n=1 Tax=Microcoleus sp. N9_B4 TaxID=3055386 RepID=UPI002FD752C0
MATTAPTTAPTTATTAPTTATTAPTTAPTAPLLDKAFSDSHQPHRLSDLSVGQV